MSGSTPHPGATPTEPAVPARPLDGAEPNDDVARLLSSEHGRLVEMDTGHRPMFSQPREPARSLLRSGRVS